MKKYTAATVEAALAAIRAELGPDAAIVHQTETKRSPGGRAGGAARGAEPGPGAARRDRADGAAEPVAGPGQADGPAGRPAPAPPRPGGRAGSGPGAGHHHRRGALAPGRQRPRDRAREP